MTTTVLIAIAIPLLMGRLVVLLLRLERAGFAERWAQAWFGGAAILATMMVLVARFGLTISLVISLAMIIALVIAASVARKNGEATRPTVSGQDDMTRSTATFRWWPVFAALILLRVAWVVADARLVPEHMTDAVENWLLRAKVIVENRGRVSTDPGAPYYLAGGRVSYPLGMPMLAAWPALLHGAWDERIVNTVWPVYYAALLALAGSATARRAGAAAGWITAYVLSSLPLPAIHAVRAGYADLLVAGHLLAACVLWCDAIDGRRRGAVALATLNTVFLVLLKREGLVLCVLLIVPVALMAARSARAWLGVAAMGAAAFALARLSDLSYVGTEVAGLGWHPEAIRAFRQRLFTWDTWGLLFWFLTPLLPLALWRMRRRLIAIHCMALIGFVAFVFLFTANAAFAVNGWTFDRSVMQIVPVLVCATAFGLCLRRNTMSAT